MRVRDGSRIIFTSGLVVVMMLGAATPHVLAANETEEGRTRIDHLRARAKEAVQAFRDKKEAKEQRLKEIHKIVNFDREDFKALFLIFEDRDEDDDIRWAALRNQPLDEKVMAAELNVLHDIKNGGAKLHANLISDLAGRARSQHHSKVFHDVVQTVRGLLDDKRDEVRAAAFRFLTSMQDPASIGLVVEGLMEPARALIPPEEAIGLLHVAGAAKHAAVIRPYLDHPNTIVRTKAALAAAIDADSRPKIIRLLKDRGQPSEVRLAALRGLSGADMAFPDYAMEIIKDINEAGDVRKAAINRFVGFMNYNKVAKDRQMEFVRLLERIAAKEDTGPGSLGELAKQVSAYVRQNFPSVSE